MTAPSADFPAAMPEFKDAQGLDALLAGGRTRRASAIVAAPEASAAPTGPKWPPPETPEFLKSGVEQLDATASMAFDLEPAEKKLTDSVADQVWPALHVFTDTGERPSNGALIGLAIFAIFGLAAGKFIQYKKKEKEDAATPDQAS
jgi:hypothetical protein